jgi:hypothetical protein
MNTQALNRHIDRRNTRSVLECGGPPPLFPATDLLRPDESARGLAQSKTWRLSLALLLSTLNFQLSTCFAQYSLDWSTIDGGGGTSTGGVYSVSGTIGQPDVGAMSGGAYTLSGGFWGLVAAVQTPGAPLLSITLNSQLSTLTVSWPLSETPWQLQATTNLVTTGSDWAACSYTTNGANCIYIESLPAGRKFYRLKQP